MSEQIHPADFQALLKLQELDVQIDQLRHRRSHSAAHDALAEIQTRAGFLRPSLITASRARDEMAGKQLEIESEVEAIEHRVSTINARLYDGSANIAPSDALAMSQEVSHLTERRSVLEDRELAVMEELEPLQDEVAKLEEQALGLAREMQANQKIIIDEQSEIDRATDGLDRARREVVKGLASVVLDKYEELRVKLGGVAIVKLAGNICEGCHLALSPTEISRIQKAPKDEILYCDECGRILVR